MGEMPGPPVDENDLAAQLKLTDTDEAAWSEAVKGTWDTALRAAGPGSADNGPEDIAQEAFFALWKARGKTEVTNLPGLVYRAAQRKGRDAYRRASIRPKTVDSDVPEQDKSARKLDEYVSTHTVLENALAGLSPDHRAAIELVHLQDYTVAAAARELGVPPGTVKSRVHYGLRQLKGQLDPEDFGRPRRNPTDK